MKEGKHVADNGTGKVEEVSQVPRAIGLTMIITGCLYTFYGLTAGLYLTFFVYTFGWGLPVTPGTGGSAGPLDIFQMMGPVAVIMGGEKLGAGFLSIAAIIAGAGLMQYKKWGSRFSRMWAIAALASLVLEVILHVLVVIPIIKKFYMGMLEILSGIDGTPDVSSFFEEMVPFAIQWSTIIVISTGLIMAILPGLVLYFLSELPRETFHD